MNRAEVGDGAAAGRCRHCGCTEDRPCRLEDGETCVWLDSTRTVCSAPGCIVRERKRQAIRVARMARGCRRRTPAEVHEQIMREAREKRRRARKRRAA